MATDQASLESTRLQPEIQCRQSRSSISENRECAASFSSFDELSKPSANACMESHGFRAQLTFAEYVECKFAPEYIAPKTSAGRMHFRSILKFVLTPDTIERVFKTNSKATKLKVAPIAGWPYLDSTSLCDVTCGCIQRVVSGALSRGYSVQTATHIRNVIRTIFAHAAQSNFFSGENPAASVILPRIVRKPARVLTLDQLTRFLQEAQYPERDIALMATLTTMSIAEICGLQWKYVNVSELRRSSGDDWLDARTIAVRMQSCRGEFRSVVSNRNRSARLPELLTSMLSRLRGRTKFNGPEDFVFASRSGSPVSQDNLASRKLKVIGRTLGIPWLSWHVFRRSYSHLNAQLGRQLQNELKAAISVERASLRTY